MKSRRMARDGPASSISGLVPSGPPHSKTVTPPSPMIWTSALAVTVNVDRIVYVPWARWTTGRWPLRAAAWLMADWIVLPLEPAGTSNTVRLLFGNTPGNVGAVMFSELRATVWLSTLMIWDVPCELVIDIGLLTVNVLPTATISDVS